MTTSAAAGSGWAAPEPVRRAGGDLAGPVLLDQRWRDLTFLHWRVEPARVATLLPPGTRPDLYDGSAWVGLIPFRLTDAAFGHGPALPYVGSFAETNVRLYSVDRQGRRGVVFGSLDAERLAFVLGARLALGLNYTWSRMSVDRAGDTLTYRSRRRWPGPRGAQTFVRVQVGSREIRDDAKADFLTARFRLHTTRLGRTLYLPNTHTAWPLVEARLLDLDDELLAAAGLPGLATRPPDSVLFSAGVRTQFGRPQLVRPARSPRRRAGSVDRALARRSPPGPGAA